jgi:anti-sigma B factor antagonist
MAGIRNIIELKLLKKDDVYMISAKGIMDLYSSIPLKDLVIKILGKNIDKLIINLANIDDIDSGGIGALINICSTVQKLNAKLFVINIQQSVKDCIKSMKVAEYIPLADSVAEAVSLLNKKR